MVWSLRDVGLPQPGQECGCAWRQSEHDVTPVVGPKECCTVEDEGNIFCFVDVVEIEQ